MYSNENNRKVVSDLEGRVRDLVSNEEKLEGGFLPFLIPLIATAITTTPSIIRAAQGKGMSGGSALGSSNQFMDTGFEMGSGEGEASYKKGGKKASCDCEGGGFSFSKFKELMSKEGVQPIRDSVHTKMGRGKKGKSKAKIVNEFMEEDIGGMMPKSGMKSSNMSGGKKRVNKRAEIVKKVMKERGVKMIEASKIVKAEGLY